MLLKLWHNTLNRLRHSVLNPHLRNWPDIVDKTELERLRNLAVAGGPTRMDLSLEVQQRMLGECLSPYAHSGFEFAETRLYQQGDNIRFINWRRYANSGQLFVNMFHEEKRPQCWLVLDRRASMRFGTQHRLKVAQAARFALYHLFKAQRHQYEIGAVVLDAQSHWYDARSASNGFHELIQHMRSATPPLAESGHGLLSQCLRILNARINPGCLIIIISDFIDLDESILNSLSTLAAQHTISTIHIVDPIERQLPHKGHFHVQNPKDGSLISLDCNQAGNKAKLEQQLQARLSSIEQQLTRHQTFYQQIASEADLTTDH